MVASELIKRSPIRILEKSTHGGLGKGNLGVFAGPKGVGKTACLVHFATDRLLQERHVIHVSFTAETSHINTWYENIFKELARRYELDGAMDVHDCIIRNRVITSFAQPEVQWPVVEKTLRSVMEEGGFCADTVVVDGYGFPGNDLEAFTELKRFSAEMGLEVWFSASVRETAAADEASSPPPSLAPYMDDLAVVVMLVDRESYIHLELTKDHGNPVHDVHLKLDPHILLIAEENEGLGCESSLQT